MRAAVLIFVVVALAAILIGWLIYRAGWQKAQREAEWRPNSRDVNGRVEIIIEKFVEYGFRSEVLATEHVEWMDSTLPATVYEIAYAESMGRARNRASAKNALL